jgi:predicted kinase
MVTHFAELTIILGSPASGKTTLAQRLAAHLSVPCLCKDDVKEALFDAVGSGDRDWSRRLSEASFAVLARLARAQLGLGRSLIVEGNWRPSHTSLLAAALEAASARAVQIRCRAEPAEIVRRFTLRSRHAGHLDAQLARTEIESAALREHEFLDLPGRRLEFRSDETESYETLLEALQATAL